MKRLTFLILIAVTLLAQTGVVAPTTIADITGDAASHQLATSGQARWLQFVAPAANSAAIRIGDSNVGASRGTYVAPGGGFMMPVLESDSRESTTQHFYKLSSIYYYAGSGDKITITYAN